MIQRAGEEAGEEGEDVEAQAQYDRVATGLEVEFGEAIGKCHADGFRCRIEREEECADERDQYLIAGWREDGKEGGGVDEAVRAVGGGGELYAGDGAERLVAVVEGAADEVGDVGCICFQGHALCERDENFVACELLGLLDGVDAPEVEDDAASIAPDGKPVRDDLDDTGRVGGGSLCAGLMSGGRIRESERSEPDVRLTMEALGKVGEQVGEHLSLSPLGPKDAGQHNPLRCRFHGNHVRASMQYTWNWQWV